MSTLSPILNERIVKFNSLEPSIIKFLSIIHAGVRQYRYVYIVSAGKYFVDAEWSNSLSELRKWIGFKDDLRIFLTVYPNFGLMNLSFFLDLRHRCKLLKLNFRKALKRNFETHGIVDDILKDSHGFLIWHYQIESLVRLFYFEVRKVRELTDGLILKQPKYWQATKRLKLNNDFTLHRVLEDRLILPDCTTIPPRLQFAGNLHNILKNF